MKTAKELFDELNSWDENRRIEAKSASAVGKSMMETVCAFANEPGLRGGYLLLGAKRTGMTEDGKPVYEPERISRTQTKFNLSPAGFFDYSCPCTLGDS